ncbi:histidine phosphatase superfamily-domain-containing protein [Gorgonomyces haynaldii]|nr:histidine phosphatase superfamily-domain-containing protein [Gorgonomyces haynaldii]
MRRISILGARGRWRFVLGLCNRTLTRSKMWVVGVCAMEQKARSKPMRNILDRIISKGDFEIIIFGDKVILDEEVENWPVCDFLISFFSNGFPLEKAIDYLKLRKPFCLNDLPMQEVLLDRRLVLSILDSVGVPTPRRLVTWHRDTPHLSKEVAAKLTKMGLKISQFQQDIVTCTMVDHETIQVGNETLSKPFVEKPISGEDHNIYIYYSKAQGGGVRKLFRKVRNKSSEFVPDEYQIRCDGADSYIYEEFIDVDNAEDVKVYTIGPNFAHAETRKSPVVDGIVHRNPDGKEIRYVTELSDEEREMAKRVCEAFGQTICGFDLLRANGKSFVIDVNGWSFVKGNLEYYDKTADTIREIFLNEVKRRGPFMMRKQLSVENQWKMKGFFSVMRHGDRTPKQKVKFTFKSETFLQLVRGSEEEIVLKKPEQVKTVYLAVQQAIAENIEDANVLKQLSMILDAKGELAGSKVQLRPYYSKEQTPILEKMQIIVKWGGLLTHGGHFHSQDLGSNLKTDLSIINKDLLNDVTVYSSSEMRVVATAESFCKAFLDKQELPQNLINVSKEMLDDSNAAKEQMDQVKARLQRILNPEHPEQCPPEFVMPPNTVDLAVPVQTLIDILTRMRQRMKVNLEYPYNVEWCTPETPFLFQERWEKLFRDFCDVERTQFEPSKISELYDTLKFDLLHNRTFVGLAFASPDEDLVKALYKQSKIIFDIIGPHEYGIDNAEKLLIGSRNTQFLLKQLCSDLEYCANAFGACTRLYFTKESKVYCLLNFLLLCGLKTKIVPTDVPELDYLTQITFEVYERSGPFEGKSREYSLRLALSLGAHDPNLIDLELTPDHSLTVEPRKWISDHISLQEALQMLRQ